MTSLKGHLLVATTELLDPNFFRTVLLIFEHSEEGSAGIVLNRPTTATVAQISSQVFQEEFAWEKPIHLGGPVPGTLVVLHAQESLSDQEVVAGLYTTADPDKLRILVRQEVEPSLFAANYAGWGSGQLESEIEENSWRSLPASVDYVFWSGEQDLWEVLMKEIHASDLSKILRIRDVPDDPNMN